MQKFTIEITKEGDHGGIKFMINEKVLNFTSLDFTFDQGNVKINGTRQKLNFLMQPTEDVERIDVLQYMDYYFDNNQTINTFERLIQADLENINLTSRYNAKAFIKEEGKGFSEFEYLPGDERGGGGE